MRWWVPLTLLPGEVLAQEPQTIVDISLTNNFFTMVTAIAVAITAVTGLISMAYAKRSAAKVDQNSAKLEEIHQVTNSNFSAQREEIKKLNETIAALVGEGKAVVPAPVTAAAGHPITTAGTLTPTTETVVPTVTTIKTEPA